MYNPTSSNISNVDPLYTKEINANLEYSVNSTKVLDFPIIGGYDLLVEPSLFVIRNGDNLVSNVENFSNLTPFNSSNVTVAVDHNYANANVIGTTTQSILEGSTYVAPFKFSDITLSSRNNGVSYRPSISNGIDIDNQTALSNLNAADTQTIYSGPTPITTNPIYKSNVIYTQSNTSIYVNNSLFANTAYKTTYNPSTTIKLDSHPDTFSLDGQTPTTTSQFSNLLTYSNISYNGAISYGDVDTQITNSRREIYAMGFTQYASNIYCVGGIDTTGSRLTNVFKYDIYPPPSGSLEFDTISLTSYTEPVSYAQCTFSSDKLYVFAPVTNSGFTKVLRYIDFDAASHILLGEWKLESTGFTGATDTIFAPGFDHVDGKLFVVGGNADQLGPSNGIYYYDLTGRIWNQVTLGVSVSPVQYTPTFSLGSKLYFFDGNNNGYITDTSNAYS